MAAKVGLLLGTLVQRCYWTRDLHHTPDGYRVMGQTIARHVVNMGLLEGGTLWQVSEASHVDDRDH